MGCQGRRAGCGKRGRRRRRGRRETSPDDEVTTAMYSPDAGPASQTLGQHSTNIGSCLQHTEQMVPPAGDSAHHTGVGGGGYLGLHIAAHVSLSVDTAVNAPRAGTPADPPFSPARDSLITVRSTLTGISLLHNPPHMDP